MASARPIPAFISEAAGADRGLICGFQLVHGARPREIAVDEMLDSLSRTDAVTWLHFNLGEVRARRWLQESEFLPLELRELLQELDDNRRIEAVNHGVLVVMSDFTFEDDSDPSEVAPLWCFATRSALITARMHPLKGVDDLRLAMRDGLTANSGVQLIVQLLEFRTSYLRRRADEMIERLDDIEDEILAGSIRQQREQLGRTRRICARLRRQFVPERADLTRFLRRDATQMSEEDADALQSEAESLGFAIEEIAELYERAKLLQEELGGRLAENTGRNLYVLSVLTAVLLPMTLVTGIFGMNVAGMPGLHDPGSFWRVMLFVVASGGVTLMGLLWRRLL